MATCNLDELLRDGACYLELTTQQQRAVQLQLLCALASTPLPVPPEITGTPGSVLFFGADGAVTQDNDNLFWDDTNNRLGIGTNSPTSKFHLVADSDEKGIGTFDGVTNPYNEDILSTSTFSVFKLDRKFTSEVGGSGGASDFVIQGIDIGIEMASNFSNNAFASIIGRTGVDIDLTATNNLSGPVALGGEQIYGFDVYIQRSGNIATDETAFGIPISFSYYGMQIIESVTQVVSGVNAKVNSQVYGSSLSVTNALRPSYSGGVVNKNTYGIGLVVNGDTSGAIAPTGGDNTYGIYLLSTVNTFGNTYGVYLETLRSTSGTAYGFWEGHSTAISAYNWFRSKTGIGNADLANTQLKVVPNSASLVSILSKGAAAQTANLFECRNSSDALLFGIEADGDIRTSRSAAATTLGSVTDRLPIYDAAGSLIGYIPIYDSIT